MEQTAAGAQADLQRAIALFGETTARLSQSYERLKDEVRELRGKLDEKHRELGRSLAERHRLEGYLEHLLESVPSGVVAVDPEGRITTLNRAAQEITGLGVEAVGARFSDVFPVSHEAAGSEASLEALQDAPRREVEIRKGDGETALLGLRVSPFRSENGEVHGRVVVFQDVTLLKRLELQEARNSRLVAMGEMAAGIAHEIRNPLGSLELFASHLVEELAGTAHDDLAAHVLKGIQNLSRITGNLLLFARKAEPKLSEVDLGEVLSESALYAKAALSAKGVELEAVCEPCSVLADRDLLRQVFLNLLLNAIQAVSEGGRIRISNRFEPDETPPVVIAQVSDDGPGVPPETRERVFDPFYTTRSGGMGLGLAIVQRIVAAHGGWVSVSTGGLGGAEFSVALPISGETEAR